MTEAFGFSVLQACDMQCISLDLDAQWNFSSPAYFSRKRVLILTVYLQIENALA